MSFSSQWLGQLFFEIGTILCETSTVAGWLEVNIFYTNTVSHRMRCVGIEISRLGEFTSIV